MKHLQALLAREPGRFRRPRLEARLDAYRELLRAYRDLSTN